MKVKVSDRKISAVGGSAASVQRLRVGLVPKAPKVILRADDWTVVNTFREDLGA